MRKIRVGGVKPKPEPYQARLDEEILFVRDNPVKFVRELPELLRAKAMQNARTTDYSDEETMQIPLAAAFAWGFSPEGHEFWRSLTGKVPVDNAQN